MRQTPHFFVNPTRNISGLLAPTFFRCPPHHDYRSESSPQRTMSDRLLISCSNPETFHFWT